MFTHACIYLYTYTNIYLHIHIHVWGFPNGSVVKNPPANVGDVGSILRSGGSPGAGNGNLFHYSCLENSMDRGAWSAVVQWVAKSQTQLSD